MSEHKILFKSPSIHLPIEAFDKIDEFNFRVVKLSNTHGGCYFTVLPISSPDFRQKNNTKSRVELRYNKTHVIFDIYDDWNDKSELHIPKTMSAKIEAYKQLAFDLKLVNP